MIFMLPVEFFSKYRHKHRVNTA